MTARLVGSVLGACLLASTSIVAAQAPKKAPAKKVPAKKGPVAPAKDAAPAPVTSPADAPAAADPNAPPAADPVEEAPAADIEGRDENPNAPRVVGDEPPPLVAAPPPPPPREAYPTEETLRPITLPRNMAEVSLNPHAQLGFGDDIEYQGAADLRARYGITDQVQLGLTYVLGGVYRDPAKVGAKLAFHPGKAVGVDATVLIRPWIGVKVGVPVYIDSPGSDSEASGPAVALTLGAPIKFVITDKLAFGGFEDVVSISLNRFAPTLYQDATNAGRAAADDVNTVLSRGYIRLAAYAVYQQDARLSWIGRIGVTLEDFESSGARSNAEDGGLTTFLRAGLQYTPRKYLDLAVSLGFDDLSLPGSLGPAGTLAIRI